MKITVKTKIPNFKRTVIIEVATERSMDNEIRRLFDVMNAPTEELSRTISPVEVSRPHKPHQRRVN